MRKLLFLSGICLLMLLMLGLALNSEAEVKNPSVTGSEMILVDKGTSLAPIILPKDPTLFTKLAAKDLAEYIGKTGGVKPNIIEGLPNPVPEHAIWVGFQPKLKELFPGTDFDFKNPEEILIKSDGKNLVIAGRDVWDPKAMNIKCSKKREEQNSYLTGFQFANRDVEGYQSEYGTVNAVYTFLQDNLGVRWLWPGADGEVVPTQARIAFKPFEVRYHPKLRMRHSIFVPISIYRLSGAPGVKDGDWVRRQRVQLDSLYAPSAHGFADWYDRFNKTHPEYFALLPDGTREWKREPIHAKICESNPGVWDQWLKDVEEIIAKYPHRTIFNAAANDSYNTGICLCKKCRAWDAPSGEPRVWMYPGSGPDVLGVALSDRQVTFANMLGRKLKERFPGKDYKVMILAYGYSRPAPIKAIPDDNVIVGNVASCFSDADTINPESPDSPKAIDQFDAWSKKTKNQIWRPNTADPAHWRTGGPPDITGAGEIFKKMADKGILGISIDQVWLWWATQGPQYYLMAQLAWNPDRSIDEIMDDYYKAGFGPAAEEVKAFWKLMENNRREIQKSEKKDGGKSWIEAFSPEFFKEAYSLLDKAAEKAVKAGKEYSNRVAYVRPVIDYMRLSTENQALAAQMVKSDKKDPALVEKMRENWKQIEVIIDTFQKSPPGTYAKSNQSSGMMAYMHPDADHKALEKKRQEAEDLQKRINLRLQKVLSGLE